MKTGPHPDQLLLLTNHILIMGDVLVFFTFAGQALPDPTVVTPMAYRRLAGLRPRRNPSFINDTFIELVHYPVTQKSQPVNSRKRSPLRVAQYCEYAVAEAPIASEQGRRAVSFDRAARAAVREVRAR